MLTAERFNLSSIQENIRQAPGFFTPYQSADDFAKTLISPVITPLVFAGLSVFCGVVALAAPIIAAGSFIVAASAVAQSQDTRNMALMLGSFSVGAGLVCAVLAPIFLIVAAISPFLQALKIVTRSTASAYRGVESLLDCGQTQDETQSPSQASLI